MEQDQFLEVIDRDEAERRFHAALQLDPLGEELIALGASLGRVLARDVIAEVDVPSFDRSNFDGFAVQAAATFGASEERPRRLRLLPTVIATGVVPNVEIGPDQAIGIATGGMIPRGADAIVMVEHAEVDNGSLIVRRAVTPGSGVSFAGTDIARGEVVLRQGALLTSRETGVLAAVGVAEVAVWKEPRVGILSTGDEIAAPGQPARAGLIYDSNARILADAVRELGGVAVPLGIVPDDAAALRQRLTAALAGCDVVLLSGGTSKGAGDISYRVAAEWNDPGIVAHGVALKPGKPICLAVTRGKPVVILPGFPTSAIFTFHEFVAPVIRRLGGRPPESRSTVSARLATKVNSEIGRTEYLLVSLVERTPGELIAYPMGKGSGSVTTFSQADGFITIGRHEEILESGRAVEVQLLSRDWRLADLVVIGSHCAGLDLLLSQLQARGWETKFLAVGSLAGLEAARRGECDIAGIHVLDPDTGEYNRPFVSAGLRLVRGYGRLQGLVYRRGDARFEGLAPEQAIATVREDRRCRMVNRNAGSGTRMLIDRLLQGARPNGYAVQPRNHNAVAAAVAQGRADWGVAIQSVAERAGLGFLPLVTEQYDFVVPEIRSNRPAVLAFCRLLESPATREQLAALGLQLD